MPNRWLGDLTEADVARMNAKTRARRIALTDKTRQEALPSREPLPRATERPPAQPTPLDSKNPGIPGVYLTFPWPPTVNHYWLPARNGRLYISAQGLSFRAQVKMLAHGVPLTAGAVSINISAHPPDKRRRDLDNILKACLDALQHAGLIEDDTNVVDLRIYRASAVKGGAVEVTIEGK